MLVKEIVTIRPVRIEDAKIVQEYASDELVSCTTNIPDPYPRDGGQSYVNKAIKGWIKKKQFTFSIIVNNVMAGNVSLNIPDFDKHTIQCDYGISSSYWGRGIASEAVSLAVSYAFQHLNMKTVTSACLERNPASARVLEKNGFVETGKFVYNNEKFKEELAHRFELTKETWLKSGFGDKLPNPGT